MKGQGRNAGGLVVTTREIPSTSASSLINTQLKIKSRHSRSYIKSLLNGSTNNTCKRIKTAQFLSFFQLSHLFFSLGRQPRVVVRPCKGLARTDLSISVSASTSKGVTDGAQCLGGGSCESIRYGPRECTGDVVTFRGLNLGNHLLPASEVIS
jgi:hypothetical protein